MKIVSVGICAEAETRLEAVNSVASDQYSILIPPHDGACIERLHAIPIDTDGTGCPCVNISLCGDSPLLLEWNAETEEVPDRSTPEPSDTKTETTYDDHPTISFDAVQACNWIGATVDVLIGEGRETLITYTRGGDDCPRNENAGYSAQWPDNRIIPGAALEITHFLDCPAPNQITGNSVIWESVCLTGGVIVGVIGNADDPNHAYRIEKVTGEVVEVAPDDWVDYREGDWVTIITVGGGAAQFGNKGGIIAEDGDKKLIVPFSYGSNPGNAGLTWQPIEFGAGDNQSLLNLRNVAGEIIEINEDDNLALVNLPRFGEIEAQFAWHCPGSGDWEDAWKAYEIGDRVNVILPGIAHDAHVSTPKTPPEQSLIVGWVDNALKTCGMFLYYMGDPLVCRNSAGETLPLDDCDAASEDYKYYRIYDVLQKLSDPVDISFENNQGLAVNKVCGIWPVPEGKSGHGLYNCYRHDSIMYDDWTAHSVAWQVSTGGDPDFFHAFCVDYRGEIWMFPNPTDPEADPSETWPDPPFSDMVWGTQFETYGKYHPAHGFDLWALESDIAAKNWRAGDVVLSICGGEGSLGLGSYTLQLWNLTQADFWEIPTNIMSRVIDDFEEQIYPEIYTRILGVKERKVIFAVADIRYAKMQSFDAVYVFDAETGEIEDQGISGHNVAFNPFLDEIWHVDFGAVETIETDVFENVSHDHSSCITSKSKCPRIDHPDGCDCWVCIGYETWYAYYPGSGKTVEMGKAHCNDGAYADLTGGGVACPSMISWANMLSATRSIGYLDGTKLQGTYDQRGGIYGFQCRPYTPAGMTVEMTGCPSCDFDCAVYDDWIETLEPYDYVSITADGTGEIREVSKLNGNDCNANIATETTEGIESGDYDENYGQILWPHIAPFAEIKHAVDSDGTEYENIVIQQDITGENGYGENGEEIFFAINAKYAPV